jgi:hypothetical protein
MPRFWRAMFGAFMLALALPASALAGVSTTTAPTLSGTAKVGSKLTCSTVPAADWTSDDGGTPSFEERDWYYKSNEADPISESFSASNTTYTVQGADVGKQIVCTQTELDGGSGDFSEGTSPFSTASAAVTPGAPPTTTGTTTIQGQPGVGNELFCEGPTWKASGGSFDFVDTSDSWYHSTDLKHALPNGSDTNEYSVAPADAGKQIVCIEIATDEDTGGTATSQSAPVAVLPTAAVTLTQYSPAVNGDIGESVSGVTVTLTLQRAAGGGNPPRTVATATTTTGTAGKWSATLTPSVAGPSDAFDAPGDQLLVAYSGGASGTIRPANATYTQSDVDFAGSNTTISSDGKTVDTSADSFDCTRVGFVIDGTTHAATQNANALCEFKPATALTDNNHVQTELTTPVSGFTGDSDLTTISDAGLVGEGFNPGQSDGAPTCDADLVTGLITCDGLNGAAFTVSNGTSSAPLTKSQLSSHAGFVEDEGRVFLTGVAAGQAITLKESGITRTLTTLHTGTLQVAFDLVNDTSGSCQPNKPFGFGDTSCPASGTFTAGDGGQTQLLDDLSGGETVLNVPTLSGLIPSSLDAIAGGIFTSYGDLSNIGSTAQILTATSSVVLTIVPHGGGSPAFTVGMTPSSDALGPFEAANVTGLAQGRYFANWALKDSHGDTRTYSNEFAVEPANTGAAGATGAQGAPGQQGPAGTSSEVKCTTKTKGKGKKKKKHTTCKVSVLAPGSHTVSVEVSRGKKTLATGTAVVRAGVAHVTLRRRGALRHGRYLITFVSSAHGHAQVVRRYERI